MSVNKNVSPGDSGEAAHKLGEQRAVPGTPLVAVAVECPVCGMESEQTSVSESQYNVGSRDVDLRPNSFVWKNKSYKNFHPPAYFVWQCPHCRYSACEEYFLHPTRDMVLSHRVFKRKVGEFLTATANRAAMAPLVASGEEQDGETLGRAIKRHLLAILILEQISTVKKADSLPLARYYTRLAWLYRDAREFMGAEEADEFVGLLGGLMAGFWDSMPTTSDQCLATALEYYETAFYHSGVPERSKCVHVVAQMIARLHLMSGNVEEGRNMLWMSIQYCSRYRDELQREASRGGNLQPAEKQKREAKIQSYNSFIGESQDLLYETKRK